ncbi:MAG: hypothetical protein WCL42_03310 [Chlorobiaceae bacterium]
MVEIRWHERGGLLLVNTVHGELPIRPPDGVIQRHDRGALKIYYDYYAIISTFPGMASMLTASVGDPLDYLQKLEHARTVEGTSYIHVFAPCPVG